MVLIGLVDEKVWQVEEFGYLFTKRLNLDVPQLGIRFVAFVTRLIFLLLIFPFSILAFVVMSEDMVTDGYEDIMNIDISLVAIEMMKKKHESIPQLNCIL